MTDRRARPTGPRLSGGFRLFALLALLVVAAGLAVVLRLPGPLRALLVLPAVLWVPGRSLLAGFGLSRVAGWFTVPLAAVLGVVATVAVGLAAYAVLGHVPLSVLPVLVSAVSLPLALRERGPGRAVPPDRGGRARRAGVYAAGVAWAAFVLWGVSVQMPTTPQPLYLSFSLAAPYAGVQGVLPVTAGQRLSVPLEVDTTRPTDLTGLSVAVLVDDRIAQVPVPVRTEVLPSGGRQGRGTVRVDVTVPEGCLHRVDLILLRGTTRLRNVDLYLRDTGARTEQGAPCGT